MLDNSQSEREARRLAEGREVILATVMAAEKKGKVDSLPYQNYLIRQAIEELAADVKATIKGKKGARAYAKFAQYLGTIDVRLASLRAIQAVLGVLLREGGADEAAPVWKKAAYAAGQAVYSEYLMQHFKKLNPALFNSLAREYSRSMTRDERHLLAAFKAKFAKTYKVPLWDHGDIEGIGNYVLTQLTSYHFLESWSATQFKNGKPYTVRFLRLDESLRGAALEIMDRVADLPRVAGPMIEEPLPWDAETNTGGGFHTPEMQRMSAYAVQGKGIGVVAPKIVQMLNSLQRRQWQINEPVLKAVRKTSLRRDFGDIVSPAPMTDKPEMSWPEGAVPDAAVLKAWKQEARKWYTEKKVRAVKHLRAQKVFREAADLTRYPTIWFTYYADFRGRAYARSSSVSPQGNDLEKGLLRLKNGKPLSSVLSTFWFKVHGANKFNVKVDGKKLERYPLTDRIRWVDDNHDFIVAIGSDPAGNLGWTEAESPVQFLAWAMEYAQWSADPDGFSSHLPIGQDGTCNGLQNFSALMCDAVGGAAVNLVPADAPRDIYSDVAERVVDLLRSAAQDGLRDGWLLHGITRDVTKRPTMTLPYGVTRFATSTFIREYMEEDGFPEIAAEEWGDAANYLSYKVWEALGEVVVKAVEVMDWLKGWAKHAVQNDLPVAWIAPSGLHVVSEYEAVAAKTIKSIAFKTQIKLYKPSGKDDLKKTMNAVAPNFVHSLDASHMAAVVARAEAEGMEIVTIHDDFGVHAEDTERFHAIIREEFVAQYEDNTILEDMAASTGYEVPPPPKGDLNIRDVLRSTYFFA